MTRWLPRALFVLALLSNLCPLAVNAQGAEDRVAFIIGNGGYPKSLALKNPLNDATAIEKQLSNLGFETKSYKDLKVAEVSGLRQQMESRLKRNSVLFFYYAGHGVQIDGRNYLLPVDATLNDGDKASQESLYLGDVLHAIERMRPKIAVVILDACRDNPFKDQKNSSALKQGLARVDPPTSTVVFYATRPGGTAQDGDDENGVFTKALLQEIVKPEQPLEVVFRRVSTSVFKSTKSEQEPWIEGVIREEFFVNQGVIQKPLQPIAVAVAIPQVEKEPALPPVKNPEHPTEVLVSAVPSSNSKPTPTQLEVNSDNEEKLLTKSFGKTEALKRLALSIQKKDEISTPYLCDANGCYDYAEWVKTIELPANLENIKSAWKKIEITNTPVLCEYDIQKNICTKEGFNSFILSPLAIIPGLSNAKLESWRYSDIKITRSGGLQFSADAKMLGMAVIRPPCATSNARIEFGRTEIQFDISRISCMAIGPITQQQTFKILLFDIDSMELTVQWNSSGFGIGAIQFGSGIGRIKL